MTTPMEFHWRLFRKMPCVPGLHTPTCHQVVLESGWMEDVLGV